MSGIMVCEQEQQLSDMFKVSFRRKSQPPLVKFVFYTNIEKIRITVQCSPLQTHKPEDCCSFVHRQSHTEYFNPKSAQKHGQEHSEASSTLIPEILVRFSKYSDFRLSEG